MTETTDSKTEDKGGLLWWAQSMELVNAFCIEPRLIVQAYLFLLLFLFCFVFLDFLLKLRAALLKSYVPLNSLQSPTQSVAKVPELSLGAGCVILPIALQHRCKVFNCLHC